MISPEYELYLITLRALSLMDEIMLPENSLKKATRSINRFVEQSSEAVEKVSTVAHERSVHNFNVIMNSIDNETLELPIGSLTIEK